MEDDYFLKSYSLCQRHIDYLDGVNPSIEFISKLDVGAATMLGAILGAE